MTCSSMREVEESQEEKHQGVDEVVRLVFVGPEKGEGSRSGHADASDKEVLRGQVHRGFAPRGCSPCTCKDNRARITQSTK